VMHTVSHSSAVIVVFCAVGCTIFIGIILAIPISMIAMGEVYLSLFSGYILFSF